MTHGTVGAGSISGSVEEGLLVAQGRCRESSFPRKLQACAQHCATTGSQLLLALGTAFTRSLPEASGRVSETRIHSCQRTLGNL